MTVSAIRPAKTAPMLGRLGLQLWYLRALQKRQHLPAPKDLPTFKTGPNPWRILLIGNGPTHGWGVFSHRFSLTGQLAIAMQEMRGQAMQVDYVGEEMMNAETAKHWIGNHDLTQYDQIIIAIGWNDAARLTPATTWDPTMTDLLDDIENRKNSTARMLITGIEPLYMTPGYEGTIGKIVQRHADRMNTVLETYAHEHDMTFMPLTPHVRDIHRPQGSAESYRARANEIAAVAANLLPTGTPTHTDTLPTQKFNWIGASYALGLNPRSTGSKIFTTLEEEARDAFSVELAQISILDGDKQWMLNHSGPVPASVPRHLTYCDVAAKQNTPLIISNSKKDDRFNTNPYLDHAGLPFYAGQALFARNGEVIGTFCLLAAVPRPKRFFRMKKFQQFAVRAQLELWRIEDEAVAAEKIALVGAYDI